MRRLARRVARERVSGFDLNAYMRRLLESEHLELCAACRLEAARLSVVSAGLSPRALAKALRRRARALDRDTASGRRPDPVRLARGIVAAAGAASFAYGIEEMFAFRGGAAAMAVGGWLFLTSLSYGKPE